MTTGSTGNMGAELAFAIGEHRRKVEQVSLPVARHFNLAQALGMANHFIYRAEAKRCHNLTQLLGNEEHKVHHVLGLAAEALAQAAVLRGNTSGARILLAVALHQAAHSNERHRRKTELFSAEQAGHGNILAIHQLAVSLKNNAGTQAILQQRLLSLSHAKLERQTCMPDGIARSSARTAIMARDQDLVSSALGNAGCDGANAGLGNELHGNARIGVCVLQVEDQLCQVFDGIDVMMRRRRNQANARSRLANFGDPGIYLLTRQVAAFARLCTLSHLNLYFFGTYKIS